MRLFLLAIPLVCIFSCSFREQQLKELATLELNEVSGIKMLPGDSIIWTIEDSGNKNIIYGLGSDGKTKRSLQLKDGKNTDWEDIAGDLEGNLYVGDFGNNDNKRKDLVIYKISKENVKEGEIPVSAKTAFYFPEQTQFPPKKSERFFDVEAFIERNGNFYLFTKNRSAKFDGSFMVYKIPNKDGVYPAVLLATLKSCSVYGKCAITGADISPDGKTIVLLSGDKIWLLNNFEDDSFRQENMKMYDLHHYSQKEGVCFKDDNTLLIADEREKNAGGYLYELRLDQLKAKH